MGFSKERWWTGDRESLLTGKPSVNNIDALEDSEVLDFFTPYREDYAPK